jgi:hypothetical protein
MGARSVNLPMEVKVLIASGDGIARLTQQLHHLPTVRLHIDQRSWYTFFYN